MHRLADHQRPLERSPRPHQITQTPQHEPEVVHDGGEFRVLRSVHRLSVRERLIERGARRGELRELLQVETDPVQQTDGLLRPGSPLLGVSCHFERVR